MKNKQKCRVYFAVTGKFDCKEIAAKLGLEPFDGHCYNDIRADGKEYGFSRLCFCLSDRYDPYAYKQMEQTIAPLEGKTNILIRLKEEYSLTYTLEVVPEIFSGNGEEVTQCLSPSMRVIDFCAKVRCGLDIDYYIY